MKHLILLSQDEYNTISARLSDLAYAINYLEKEHPGYYVNEIKRFLADIEPFFFEDDET